MENVQKELLKKIEDLNKRKAKVEAEKALLIFIVNNDLEVVNEAL